MLPASVMPIGLKNEGSVDHTNQGLALKELRNVRTILPRYKVEKVAWINLFRDEV
jgi:hypothetical protein